MKMKIDHAAKMIDLTENVLKEFLKVENTHDYEVNDFTFHIHALQNIIFSQIGSAALVSKSCIKVLKKIEKYDII